MRNAWKRRKKRKLGKGNYGDLMKGEIDYCLYKEGKVKEGSAVERWMGKNKQLKGALGKEGKEMGNEKTQI